jgi:hypothetical protein
MAASLDVPESFMRTVSADLRREKVVTTTKGTCSRCKKTRQVLSAASLLPTRERRTRAREAAT